MSKILSIVIPVFNKFNYTRSCLNDLSRLSNDHEIIIVDNGSSDETEKELSGSTEIAYIREHFNNGFAHGCNLGYSVSQAPNVMFLNNDIRVTSNHNNWTKSLIEKCSTGLVGPTMGKLDNNFNFLKEANEQLDGNSYMSGWCLASSKDIWNRLEIKRRGGVVTTCYSPIIFSTEFGLAYFEDTDLSFRARQLGIDMKVISIPVFHFGKVSSKQLNTYELYSAAKKIFINKWQGKI